MILVAGGQLDPNIGTLLRRILRRRVPFIDILVGPQLIPKITFDLRSDALRLNGQPIKPTACFLRHDVFLQQHTTDHIASSASLNWFYALKGWELSHSSVRSFNRATYSRENNKIQNLVIAKSMGLSIPDTIVSNDFENAKDLVNGELIQKPVAGGELTVLFSEFFASLTDADILKRFPRFIQNRLLRPELRIYRVGSNIFSFSLMSEDIDYRERHRVTIEQIIPPKEISDKLIKLCDYLGLDFAAADFMRNESKNEWCFLEINSQPMFAAFDAISNGQVTDAIIDHLSIAQAQGSMNE